MTENPRETAIRVAAFQWLSEAVRVHGDVLPRAILLRGFEFEDERIPLVAPQGIFKPRHMRLPLTITSTPKGPYQNSFGSDGLLTYKYRGTDPAHPDNQGLRQALGLQLPLIYFHGIVPGKYLAVWPVYVVGDDQGSLQFRVAVDDVAYATQPMQRAVADDQVTARRAYVTTITRVRLHQQSFRARVIAAYQSQCSLCRLRHDELLDAAHIIPDSDPKGEPGIRNGIALCKLHHAAFDSFIIGIAPDYIVHVRSDVLDETDGPMLRYGLQTLNGNRLVLPFSPDEWPDPDALRWRFDQFNSAA